MTEEVKSSARVLIDYEGEDRQGRRREEEVVKIGFVCEYFSFMRAVKEWGVVRFDVSVVLWN